MAADSTIDPMYKVRGFLDGNLLMDKDDDVTAATHKVIIDEGGLETLEELFTLYDVLFIINYGGGEHERPIDDEPYEITHGVPITIVTIDKTGITGKLMLHKSQRSLNAWVKANKHLTAATQIRIRETPPTVRSIRIGGKTVWEATYMIDYTYYY